MPVQRLPLVGVHNQRSVDGTNALTLSQDQRFLNCIFDAVKNPITGKTLFYVEKRPGWQIRNLVSAGNIGTGLIRTDILQSDVSAFGTPNSTIYDNQTSVGTITGEVLSMNETALGSIGYVMIRSTDGTGWYYPSDAKTTLTYTGTTHTNTTLDTLGSTVGMYSGQLVSKADIPAGTRILSVDSATSVTLTAAATGSAAGTVTKEPIAKILSANFVATGTNISGFVDLGGFLMYCTEDGYIYQSDINTVHLYTAINKMPHDTTPDLPVAIMKQKEWIICGGRTSTEFYKNAGNSVGSVLSRVGTKSVGWLHQRSAVKLEDDVYFVSSSASGDLHVEKITDGNIQPISTPAVDKIIGTARSTGSQIYLSAFTLDGYGYVLLQIIAAPVGFILKEDGSYLLLETGDKIILEASSTVMVREMVYNVNLNLWSEWDSTLLTYVKGVGSGSINQIIASSRLLAGGKTYQINPSSDSEVYTDDGSAYSMIIQTAAFDLGTNKRKTVHSITIIADTPTSGTLTIETSDDDFVTWVSRGTIDLTSQNKRLTGIGSHKGARAYRFTHSSNAPFRAQAIDIDYSVSNI